MRKVVGLFCFSIICFYCTAQTDNLTEIPISLDSFLRFRTIREALTLPEGDEITQCKILFARKDGVYLPSGPMLMLNPVIRNMVSLSVPGDEIIFYEIAIRRDDIQLKLKDKVYTIK